MSAAAVTATPTPATTTNRGPAVTDEWNTDRLDLDAYLTRTGYAGSSVPDVTTLIELHRAHVAAIAFENLDVATGRGVAVDLPEVQDKLVTRRRGGYCYEHGTLFAAVLDRFGYPVHRVLARVGSGDDGPRPRTHLAIITQVQDARWLVDVGFGSGLLEPVPFDGTAHHQGGWTYRSHPETDCSWALQELRPEGWTTLYTFTEERVHASDVVMANHFTATWPRSPFVAQVIAVRKDAHAVHQLLGRRLTATGPQGDGEDARVLTDAEVVTALRQVFGLHLTADEATRVTAALPAPAGSR